MPVTVTIYHNVARECRCCSKPLAGDLDDPAPRLADESAFDDWDYRQCKLTSPPGQPHRMGLANFDGYKPGHPLVPVFRTEADADYGNAAGVAERMFAAFNAPPEFLDEADRELAAAYRAGRLRSLSVGDVVQVGDTYLACASCGFRPILNILTTYSGHGTVALDN